MLRLARRLALGLALVIVVPLLLAVAGTLIPLPLLPGQTDEPANRRILIVSNPIHTDIAIPIDDTSLTALGFVADAGLPVRQPDAHWLLMGWGGRAFYLETPTFADIKPGPLFRALTLDSSVMHVDVLSSIAVANPAVLPVDISEAGYAGLLAAISASFTLRGGHVLPIEDYAFGGADRFFEAEGSFNALLGCNTWTARMLREAGLRTGLWNPLPVSLTTSLALFNRLPAAAPAPQSSPSPSRGG